MAIKTNEYSISGMLTDIENGKTQLPDFQRGWVWDDQHIRDLIASVSLSFPIGAVMTLEAGGSDVRFQPRLIEGVDESLGQIEPDTLILDGQQRLTSLFQSLKAGKAVVTRDSRGRESRRWYYLDMNKCLATGYEREDAILSVPDDRVVRTFRGEIEWDLSTPEKEYESDMFPLRHIFESDAWRNGYYNHWDYERNKVELYSKFDDQIIGCFRRYDVPVIELGKDTPKEAVCIVFEKVNQGGVSLTVFELLTASFAADDFQLRKDWDERRSILQDAHRILDGIDNTLFLQAIALLSTNAKGGAVSCRRRDILRLTADDYKRYADQVQDAFIKAARFLHGQKVFNNRDIPYRTQLVPLAAILAELGDEADTKGAREKIARWYWCGVFGEIYGGTTETQFALDFTEVPKWVRDASDDLPRTIQDANFQANRLLSLRTRNSAAYKGIHALLMRDGSCDFRSGVPIEEQIFFDDNIDIHHIFPKAWCDKQGIKSAIFNSIINKTAISARTNRSIGGRAPSAYLSTLEQNDDVSDKMDEILASHRIPAWALRIDDFDRFFADRAEGLLQSIEDAMGKPITREDGLFRLGGAAEESDINAIISGGESGTLEFKSSLRMNLHTKGHDKRIQLAALKTIAAFLNSDGGTLIIGVADDHTPVGIQVDEFQNEDKMNLHLGNIVNSSMGALAMRYINPSFADYEGARVMVVDCQPSKQPVYVKEGNAKNLYIRSGAATVSLSIEDVHPYINSHPYFS